jgi:hypothetical protein
VLSPIDESGFLTSCVIIAAILPTAASRSVRTTSRSRSWIAEPIVLNSRARSATSRGPRSSILCP